MTKQEKVIVSAYTGMLMCDFNDVQEYIEKKLGRPVYTHEFADERVQDEIREATREDFLSLCENEEEKEIQDEKRKNDYSAEEKKWLDTAAVNYVIAQADGFQQGYGQAVQDFIHDIVDHQWGCSDDRIPEAVLSVLFGLSQLYHKRKNNAKKNEEIALENGYQFHDHRLQLKTESAGQYVRIYLKANDSDVDKIKTEARQDGREGSK